MPTKTPQHDDQTVDAAQIISPALNGHPRKTRFAAGDLLSNRFRIIRFLGSGGMGEVYKAEDQLLPGAIVAVKTISADLASSSEAQNRFEREVLLTRQISHPNVCPTYQIDYHHDERGVCCFLSMKFLPGETLAARLERPPPLTPAEGVLITRQIAGALFAAHQEQIIHRDIKPSNIMLDGTGTSMRAVVMDFGLARTYDSDVTCIGSAHFLGTPGYMAPELLKGQVATAASDLYAFGLVIRQIFGGKRPDADHTPAKLPSGLPPFIPSLINHCLSEDPERRYRGFSKSLADLDLNISAEVLSPYQPKSVFTRRRWLLLAASAGCALGAGAVWEKDELTAFLNPLPRKRFVALVNWPQTSERELTPMLVAVIDALERELSRAEAFDHNLLVMPAPDITKSLAHLDQVSSSLGANLVLASSLNSVADGVLLTMKILDTGTRLLRKKTISCALDRIGALPGMAVHAAAGLLGVSQFVKATSDQTPGTLSAEAYRHLQSGEALLRQTNDEGVEKAIDEFKSAIDQDSRFALGYAKLAWAYVRFYKVRHEAAALDLAQANVTTALSLDPKLVVGHKVLGAIWYLRGRNQDALAEMQKAISIDPADTDILNNMASMLVGMGHLQAAEDMFRRVLQARPNNWIAYNDLGYLLKQQGKYQAALEAFDAGRLANPRNTLVLSNLGETALKLGLLKKSRESLERSMALRPSGIGAADLAEELRAEGKYTQALTYALKAVALDAKDDENWRELGDCYSALSGRRAEATQAFVRAAEEAESQLKVNSTDGVRWMLLALYQAKTAKLAAARASLATADKLGSADLDSQLTKARAMELLGQRQEAIRTLAGAYPGATRFEMGLIPDLQSLRADARYLAIFHP